VHRICRIKAAGVGYLFEPAGGTVDDLLRRFDAHAVNELAGICKLNFLVRRVGKDLQRASYVQDLNGTWSDEDYFPHIRSLGEPTCR